MKKRPSGAKGFVLLPKRWVMVVRSYAPMPGSGGARRHSSRDLMSGTRPQAPAMIQIAAIGTMLHAGWPPQSIKLYLNTVRPRTTPREKQEIFIDRLLAPHVVRSGPEWGFFLSQGAPHGHHSPSKSAVSSLRSLPSSSTQDCAR